MSSSTISKTLSELTSDKQLLTITEKVLNNQRISEADGVLLFERGELGFLGALANYIKQKKNGSYVYFNRNFHVEPTNICVFDCAFCSYSKKLREKGDYQAWEMSEEDIYEMVKSFNNKPVTEVHIVGGVHPKMGLEYFANLIRNVKKN